MFPVQIVRRHSAICQQRPQPRHRIVLRTSRADVLHCADTSTCAVDTSHVWTLSMYGHFPRVDTPQVRTFSFADTPLCGHPHVRTGRMGPLDFPFFANTAGCVQTGASGQKIRGWVTLVIAPPARLEFAPPANQTWIRSREKRFNMLEARSTNLDGLLDGLEPDVRGVGAHTAPERHRVPCNQPTQFIISHTTC